MPNFSLFKDDSKPEDPKKLLVHSLIRDLASQLKPERIDANNQFLKGFLDAKATGGLVNDKSYVGERLIQTLASLPKDSKSADSNLQHPPLSCMGDSYKYRTADGSNNNVLFPHIGKAGSFYARTVTPKHVPTRLPDPSVVFDALLAREGPPTPHPNKISGILLATATIIIHDIFRTSDQDQNIVNVSSYLDLSPLYGADQETQNSVRTFKDGMLKPDTFAEVRLLGQPPECPALLICYCRFHNYIAEQLAIINENDRFSLPAGINEADTEAYIKCVEKRDNDLFQTARLITSGLYVQVLRNDYIRTILNLQRTDSAWNFDPSKDYPEIFGQDNIQKGIGNQVSVEFNLLYRWHSTVSSRNERFVNDFYDKLIPNTKPEDLTQNELRAGMRAWVTQLPADPAHRTFSGLQRNAEGYFNDADLVKLLTEATEDCAGSFGARHVPIALKAIEILGIQQARRWGVATLNEVRSHFGMLPHRTFTDINSDPDVAASLEALYEDVDNVEFYPGCVVEEAKQSMTPGSGLCAGFTITRAILSDAITLLRADRFFTLDYSPVLLTAFGFKEASTDDSPSGGGVMYKLLMRAFPDWYRGNSIYASYPFTVPSEMRRINKSLNQISDYSYESPRLTTKPIIVTTWRGVNNVMLYSRSYTVPYGKALGQLGDFEYMLNADTLAATEQRKVISRAVYSPVASIDDFSRCITTITHDLIVRYSNKLRNIYEFDATKNIAILSWTQFAARLFHIPLKDSKHPDANLTDRKLYELLSAIYIFIFVDTETTKSFAVRRNALKAYKQLVEAIKPVCEAVKLQSIGKVLANIGGVELEKDDMLPNHSIKVIQRLFEGGRSVDDVVGLVITLATSIVVLSAQAMTQMLDLFLQEPYFSKHWPEIQILSSNTSPTAPEQLRRYTLEALRLTSPVSGILRIASLNVTLNDGSNTYAIKKGDSVVLDIATASRDASVFPDPAEITLDRPDECYIQCGYGSHTCMGRSITTAGLSEQLKLFGKLKALKRAGMKVHYDIDGGSKLS
ncbi:fatty acid oxygenase [Massarina eburnea CBS 473.64]|uniref:Fatty acid oxygenase n=1 Tax=Massarina eburnea CBS 473.64 TaxID=1395130 RepID=A0A6A6S5K3_9PLEO|nr:fatty acid oxygenase [Massarina eburnea CBS 473.64]